MTPCITGWFRFFNIFPWNLNLRWTTAYAKPTCWPGILINYLSDIFPVILFIISTVVIFKMPIQRTKQKCVLPLQRSWTTKRHWIRLLVLTKRLDGICLSSRLKLLRDDSQFPYLYSLLWQSPSKEDHYTFRTIPREHWWIGSVHGTPKLTTKKLRPAGFARTAQFITTKLYSLMVLFW